MSSTDSFTTTINTVIRYFNTYVGLFVLTFGIVGNVLNIVVFLSLKTFRKNPCACCLLVLSISDSGLLLSNTLSIVFFNIFNFSTYEVAVFRCKMETACAHIFGLISNIIVCYAAIDQFISTSLHKRQQALTLKSIRILIIIGILFSILYGIPIVAYYDIQILSGTQSLICLPNDKDGAFSKYIIYVGFPIVNGLLPVTIMSTFGLLAFRNVRKMAKSNIPIIRLRLEQQLTVMVLIKILNFCILVLPFLIVYVVRYVVASNTSDAIIQKQFQLVNHAFTMLLFINCADNFYIFFATSARFRQQLKFVLIDIHLKRWRAKRSINQVRPSAESFQLSVTSRNETKT